MIFFSMNYKNPIVSVPNSRISSLLTAGDVSPAQIPLLAKRPFRRNVSPAQIPLPAKGPFRRNVSPAQIPLLAKRPFRRIVTPVLQAS